MSPSNAFGNETHAPQPVRSTTRSLRGEAARWSRSVRHVRGPLPAALNDRAQDVWEPLLAIADLGGTPPPGQIGHDVRLSRSWAT